MKPIQHSSRICTGTIIGKEIYRIEDDMGIILVTQRGGKRVLSFDSGMEQSSVYMDKPYYLAHEYTQIMLLALIFVDAKHVTLLGLGGGSLAHCLSHYYKELTIDVVELRQAIIDVAYEWFNLPRISQLNVYQSDAQQYLLKAKSASTDLIFSDLYEAEGMSELQNQQGFIKRCYKTLKKNGWLVLNFHSMPEPDLPLMQTIRTVFPDICVCNVINGNWIVFCGKSPLQYDENALTRRAEALVKHVEMPLMYYYWQLNAAK